MVSRTVLRSVLDEDVQHRDRRLGERAQHDARRGRPLNAKLPGKRTSINDAPIGCL